MEIFLVIGFVIKLFLYFVHLYWKRIHYWQRRGVPSPKHHWLWGHLADYQKGNLTFNDIFHNYYRKYRKYRNNSWPILGVYSFITPSVLITDPKLAKRILTKDFANFRNRGLYHNPEDLSGNLFTLDYDKWKPFRTKLSPTFTSGQLKIMLPNVIKATKELVGVMEEDIIGGDSVLDIKDLMQRFTVEIIGSCALGLQTNSLIYPNGEFSRMAQEQTVIGGDNGSLVKFLMFSFPKVARWFRLQYMPKYMTKFYTNLVRNILEARVHYKVLSKDIIDTLREMRKPDMSKLSLNEITAHTIIFFQAGYETSAYTLTFALYELARCKDLQEKARQEIISVMRKYNNVMTYDCWGEMKYLGQIIKETLRLYPISPLIIRQCTADYKIPEHPDITIAKGQMVIIPAYSFQRDERYYDQPDVFNPDNFAEERSDNIFLSFGDGPRNCIGMRFARVQIIVGLILLLSNFTFSICEKTESPIIYKKSGVLLAPQNEIYLKVQKYRNLYEDE